MRKKIRQQYDIEFTPEELTVLARVENYGRSRQQRY